MQMDNEDISDTNLSFFDIQADEHLADKLHDDQDEEEEELRIRQKNLSQDLFSEMSTNRKK